MTVRIMKTTESWLIYIYVQDKSKHKLLGVLAKHCLEAAISEIPLDATEVLHGSPKYETRDLREGNGLGLG